MANLGIDGMVSGLDTTSLIKQLMQVEAMPQTLLKSKQSTTQTFVSALQSLNAKVSSVADAAAKAAKATSWSAYTATSSAPTTTVTASATAQPGTVSFTVDAVAASRVSVTAQVKDDGSLVPEVPPAVTVRKGDGTFVTVEPTTGSLADIAKAVNSAADAGVKATVVRVTNGTDGSAPEYRLQLTGTTTGEKAGDFALFRGRVTATTAADDLTAARLDGTTVRAAQDATVTLWKGVAGLEQSYKQASNTFSGLMTGVDVTVSAVTAADQDPVTVTVARDDAALAKLASGLVGSLGVVLSEISSRTAVTTKTNTDGTTSVTGGILSGDSAVRSIQQQLVTAASYAVDGKSPSTVGIVLGRDGSFTFDEAKFKAALADDPAGVQSMVTQLAARVEKAAKGISDKYEGSLTMKIQGQEGLVKSMGTQIEAWDRRLELRRAGLQKTYSGLEVALSKMQSQSSWLAGQLAGLSANNG